MTTEERKAYMWEVLNSYGIQSMDDFLRAYEGLKPVELGALCERKPTDASPEKRRKKRKQIEQCCA